MGLSGGVYAMGSMGWIRGVYYDITETVPLPILVLVLIVLVIAVFGILSRSRSIVKGKGTMTDYLGIIIIIGLALLVALLVGSGMFKGMRLF